MNIDLDSDIVLKRREVPDHYTLACSVDKTADSLRALCCHSLDPVDPYSLDPDAYSSTTHD
jgi:hypothetical protein